MCPEYSPEAGTHAWEPTPSSRPGSGLVPSVGMV